MAEDEVLLLNKTLYGLVQAALHSLSVKSKDGSISRNWDR